MLIKNVDVQGPPFNCPECKRGFPGRSSMGSHRFSAHAVSGTSTGSRAYRDAKVKRAYTKSTPIVHGAKVKRAYNKTKSNPLLDMVANPNNTMREIDFAISEKQAVIDSLRSKIQELADNIAILNRFKTMLLSPVPFERHEAA